MDNQYFPPPPAPLGWKTQCLRAAANKHLCWTWAWLCSGAVSPCPPPLPVVFLARRSWDELSWSSTPVLWLVPPGVCPALDPGHCCKAQALCEPGWVGSCLSLPSDRNCSSTGTKGLVGGVREASGEQQPLMCCCGVCRRGAAPGLGRRPSPRSAGPGTVGFGTRGQWPGLPCATPVTSTAV